MKPTETLNDAIKARGIKLSVLLAHKSLRPDGWSEWTADAKRRWNNRAKKARQEARS